MVCPVTTEQASGDRQHRVDERQLQVMVSVTFLDEGQRGEKPLALDTLRKGNNKKVGLLLASAWCQVGAIVFLAASA